MGVPVSKLKITQQQQQQQSSPSSNNMVNDNQISPLPSPSPSTSTSSDIEFQFSVIANTDDDYHHDHHHDHQHKEDDTNHYLNNYCDNNQFDHLKYIDDSSVETSSSSNHQNNQNNNNNYDCINKSISNSIIIDNKVDDEMSSSSSSSILLPQPPSSSSSLLPLDNDSGNASISDDHSDDCCCNNQQQQQDQNNKITTKRLRKHHSQTNSFNTINNIDKSSMMNQFILRRHSSNPNSNTININNNRLSLESSIIKKFEYTKKSSLLLQKLCNGDLIEIRCVCNCQRSPLLGKNVQQFIRSSTTTIHSYNRQRFRRSLHRQSFIYRQNYQKSMTIHGHSICRTNKQKQSRDNHHNKRNLFQLSNLWLVGRSCVRGSVDDDDYYDDYNNDQKSTIIESNILNNDSSTLNSDYCSEQFHYVYVDHIDHQQQRIQSQQTTPIIWCFHVKPFHRMVLLDDDHRNVGIIRHEPLDMIITQIMFETEERHLQRNGGQRRDGQIKSSKISIDYQLRNQEKFSEKILNKTLNVMPNVEHIRNILMESKDCYVRYHKTLLNSEHYVTFWKYGIGWSTWANQRCDILRTIRLFVERFSTLVIPDDNDHHHHHHHPTSSNITTSLSSSSKILVQNGECLLLSPSMENQLQTNLIVQCFGLQDRKIDQSIQQWIQWQVVIDNKKFNYQQLSPSSSSSSSSSSPPIVMMNDNEDDNNNNKTIDSNVSCHDVVNDDKGQH